MGGSGACFGVLGAVVGHAYSEPSRAFIACCAHVACGAGAKVVAVGQPKVAGFQASPHHDLCLGPWNLTVHRPVCARGW